MKILIEIIFIILPLWINLYAEVLTPLVPKHCDTLESPGEIWKIPKPMLHLITMKSECQRMTTSHQYLLGTTVESYFILSTILWNTITMVVSGAVKHICSGVNLSSIDCELHCFWALWDWTLSNLTVLKIFHL